MVGQVRAIKDDLQEELGTKEAWLPWSMPEVLKQYVVRRQAITWDNNTGMNPLYEQSPIADTIYSSYGVMLQQAYKTGATYITDNVDGLSIHEFNKRIEANYAGIHAYLAYRFSFHWMVHEALRRPDALEYDYTFVRQFDTWYHPNMKESDLEFYFSHFPNHMFSEVDEIPKVPQKHKTEIEDIPFVYLVGFSKPKHPVTMNARHILYGFNRAAVKLLQGNLFRWYVEEVERCYKLNGFNNRHMTDHPNLFHKILIKNDIFVIDLSHIDFCFVANKRDFPASDFSRDSRTVEKGDPNWR